MKAVVTSVLVCALLSASTPTASDIADSHASHHAPQGVDTMAAEGTFDVQITPEENDQFEGSALGRMSLAKTFHGDLEGSSEGRMLTARTDAEGSAGYVAIERVVGTLHGRRGTFVLQHSGIMADGTQDLSITIVPDSGTGELSGIRGSMDIAIDDGVHSYQLEYTLPGGG